MPKPGRESTPFTVFISGIIQGSLPDSIHDQAYRQEIAALIRRHHPEAKVYDPFAHHPDSMTYNLELARSTFLELMAAAGASDVVIAFIPRASMGTAIEIWEAYRAGRVVISVSELTANWAVHALSDRIIPDIASLEALLARGELRTLIKAKRDAAGD